jgi:hypothetical protein
MFGDNVICDACRDESRGYGLWLSVLDIDRGELIEDTEGLLLDE